VWQHNSGLLKDPERLREGAADLTAGDPDLLYWATLIGGRYMGADRAHEYCRRNAVEGELLVSVTPQKIVAFKNISDCQRVLEDLKGRSVLIY